MTGLTRTTIAVRRGALCLGAAALLTGFASTAALAADSLQVTPGGATLLNMGPGEIRTMTTDIYNPTSRDAQVSTVASVDGEIDSATGHILLTVDACSVPWTDVTPAGAAETPGDRNEALVLACAGGEEELLSDWAVMGTTYADSTFRVDAQSTTHLRTQVRLGDDAPQNMQGVHGSLSYSFASVEAPPRVPVTPDPEPTAEPRGAVTGEPVAGQRSVATIAVAAGLLAAASTLSAVLVRRRRQVRASHDD